MQERREFTRIPFGTEVRYQIPAGEGQLHPGRSEDLSLGGMRLTQPIRLDAGKELFVTLNLPQEGHVSLRAKVVWCRESINGRGGYRTGIQWLRNDPGVRARLNAFLTFRLQPEYPTFPGPGVGGPATWRSIFNTSWFIFTLLGVTAILAAILVFRPFRHSP